MSSPPIKDLYKKLGKKLKDEEKKASQNAEDKLRNYYEDELNKNYFLSPKIKQQFLQLQNSKYIDSSKLQEKILKPLKTQIHKISIEKIPIRSLQGSFP